MTSSAPPPKPPLEPGEVAPPPKPGLLRWLTRAIGPAILIAIIASIDRDELFRVISRAAIVPLLLAYLIGFAPLLVRAARLRLALGPDAGRPTYVAVLNVWAYATVIGTITPGRLGEFIKVVHLRRWGASFGSALATVLLERLPDIATLFCLASVALAWFALPGSVSPAVVTLLGVAAGAVFVGAATVAFSTPESAMGALRDRLVRRRIAERLASVREGFLLALRSLSGGAIVGIIALTTAAWAVQYVSNYLLSESLGLGLSYWQVAGISALSSLAALLPISVLGAGTRDAALIVVLAQFNISKANAVALSTLFLSLMLCQALMCSFSLASRATRLSDLRHSVGSRAGAVATGSRE